MTILELAKTYYPRLWDEERLELLVAAGRLTEAQVEEVRGEVHEVTIDDQ